MSERSRAAGFTAVGALCIGLWTAVASAAEPATLADRRRSVEERFQSESARCAERFDVNACLEDARARRRQALQAVRQEELGQAEQLRRERAQTRRDAVQARQAAAASQAAASSPQGLPEEPRQLDPLPEGSAAASSPRAGSSGPPGGGQRDSAAAERARRAEARRQAIEARRARVQQQLEDRKARGVPQVPLPTPAPSAPGR